MRIVILLACSLVSLSATDGPGPPENLSAVVSGNTVTLSWQPPSSGGSSSGYVVEAAMTPGGPVIASLQVTGLSVSVPGVPNGVYYISVRAVNAEGVSPRSNETVVTVGPGGTCTNAPNPPQALSGNVTGSVVRLSWSPPQGGCAAASYEVHAGSRPGVDDITVAATGAATTLSAVAPSGTYYVRVAALNAFGRSAASNEITLVVGGGLPVPPQGPIVLTGTQSMVITGADVVFKNDIILRDDAVLTIRDVSFFHAADFSGQYSLQARDRSRVVIENATINSSPWINWWFWEDATLQMTNVVNEHSLIWHSFQDRSQAVATNVSRFRGTVSSEAAFSVNGAQETFIETVFPAGSVVNESYPASIGTAAYRFPNSGDAGRFPRLALGNVRTTQWGITYEPASTITISDTRSLVVTFRIDSRFSGVTAEFSDLRAQLYVDRTWTTGNASLRLVNTTTLPWSPNVSGNNRLIITNSDLADFIFSSGRAEITITDSTISFVRGNDFERFTIARSRISGDVVAAGNSVINLIATSVGGQLIRLGNGQINISP